MTGPILLWLAFLSSLFGTVMYYRTATGASRAVREARWGFVISAASVVIASVLLMTYIFQHRFDVDYVYSYSSRDLPGYLLMTTFWAGQQGSFLFWALVAALVGLVLRTFAQKQKMEPRVMAAYGFLQTFLLLVLLFKSPFVMIWDAYPGQVAVGTLPPDGKGLNPLLQNMWMAIHPPILFVGFAALGAPFALAIAALWGRSFQEWTRTAFPWVLFGVVSLGAGIMIGGYWAYGVLGWGGWWGWDPVENSSLIPWLLAATLLHTLVVQMRNSNFVRTNFVLTILAYVLVVYSTFLTRSGILGESSVHSFTDPGTFVYSLLVLWLLSMLGLGGAALASRWKAMTPAGTVTGILRKDTMLGWTTAMLLLLTAVIFAGTNWPIIANATVEPAFYNESALPFGILLALLLAVSLALQWEEVPLKVALTRMAMPFGAAVALTAGMFFLGVTDILPLLFSLVSAFALTMNVKAFWSLFRLDWLTTGGPIAHVGVGLLFLGIIGSGFYGEKQTVTLPLGQEKDVMGYHLRYAGAQERDGIWYFTVEGHDVGHGSAPFVLTPEMFHSDYNNSTMRRPDYISFLTKDVYLEPISVEAPKQTGSEKTLPLRKGEPVAFGPYMLTFEKFEMQQHASEGMMSGGAMSIGAIVEVKQGKVKKSVTPVSSFDQGAVVASTPVVLNDTLQMSLLGMMIGSGTEPSKVMIGLSNPAAPPVSGVEMLVVEASVKPLMNLIWVGTVLALGGAALAIFRRRKELTPGGRKPAVADRKAEEPVAAV